MGVEKYEIWSNDDLCTLHKTLRSCKDNPEAFNRHKARVRDEDQKGQGLMSMAEFLKIWSCEKQVDEAKKEYVWVPRVIGANEVNLNEGEMKDFLQFLVIRTNESLKLINFEDLFDKFSNDYMIETKTVHDEDVARQI